MSGEELRQLGSASGRATVAHPVVNGDLWAIARPPKDGRRLEPDEIRALAGVQLREAEAAQHAAAAAAAEARKAHAAAGRLAQEAEDRFTVARRAVDLARVRFARVHGFEAAVTDDTPMEG